MRIAVCTVLLAVIAPVIFRFGDQRGGAVHAQERVTLRSDVLLYGDNTEFRNPFREGETLLGAGARVFVETALGEKASLSLGAFGNQRFGSEQAFDLARPVIALTIHGRRSSFIFGTLPALQADNPMGPDRGGTHALLPPLQRETLAFDRPYEAGMQWDLRSDRLRYSLWIEWQRVNTTEHRERFDGGANAEISLARHVALPIQLHIVHEGGQLFSAGTVNDSAAMALGVRLHGSFASLEVYGAGAHLVPDRERPDLDQSGPGFFARGAYERAGWRGHLLVWRGRHFIKDEGDPNYQSLRRNGSRYGGTRDYSELGIARRVTLAPGAVFEVSGRFHRIERYYEYSYRVLSIVNVRWKLR